MTIFNFKSAVLTVVVGGLFSVSAVAGKPNSNTKPYPYNNPVIQHMYTADAAPHVMPDGRVWMATSVDHEEGGNYSTMHEYHTFSSAELTKWTDHGSVLHLDDVIEKENPKVDDWALWAPDLVYRDGKYYLFYPVHILHRQIKNPPSGWPVGKTTYIAVAVADSPDEKFTVIQHKIPMSEGMDPAVFIDDDDQVYMYWSDQYVVDGVVHGVLKYARLKDNMIELAEAPKTLDVGADHFMEAAWMHKRKGRYYFSYHTHYQKPISPQNPDDPERMKSHLDYSWGDSPTGPLAYGGVMNKEIGVGVPTDTLMPKGDVVPWRLTQSNHGGIVEFHGQDYLFYHSSALSSWRQDEFKGPGTWTQRSVSIDSLNYTDGGRVIPVQQTLESVSPVTVKQPFEIDFGTVSFGPKNQIKLAQVELGSGYYYFDATITPADIDGRIEIRLDHANGPLVGTIVLTEQRLKARHGLVDTFVRDAKGTRDVYLIHHPEHKHGSVSLSGARFFAGHPKGL
ncbi:family 43 glycosylhydrolase [Echinimonas agarilytica]|uniref:Family 43 glycosylhydrolase n=1 Tax=Echinimonas agarilytica TaxID=1215918 RepID=A0AA42B6P1_9GAMM|nr:family 43 glycosylhydrolase [Echinimonas agarilytica]